MIASAVTVWIVCLGGDPAATPPQAQAVSSPPPKVSAAHDALLASMKQLQQQRRWKELAEQFAGEDFSAWPAASARPAAEALHLRGQAYAALKNGKQAEADLKASLRLDPQNALVWHALAENYARNLASDDEALAAHRKTVEITGRTNGWLPISSTLEIARIQIDRVETDEALRTLDAYGDAPEMPATWKIRLLRAYGHAYAARGDEQASLAHFRQALELETAAR